MNPHRPETWPDSRQRHACIVFANELANWLEGHYDYVDSAFLRDLLQEHLDQVLMIEAGLPIGSFRVASVKRTFGQDRPILVVVRMASAVDRLAALTGEHDE